VGGTEEKIQRIFDNKAERFAGKGVNNSISGAKTGTEVSKAIIWKEKAMKKKMGGGGGKKRK